MVIFLTFKFDILVFLQYKFSNSKKRLLLDNDLWKDTRFFLLWPLKLLLVRLQFLLGDGDQVLPVKRWFLSAPTVIIEYLPMYLCELPLARYKLRICLLTSLSKSSENSSLDPPFENPWLGVFLAPRWFFMAWVWWLLCTERSYYRRQ